MVEGFTPIRTLLLRVLRADGYDAVGAARAVRAVDRCRTEHFDLLVTGSEARGGAGVDIARAAREQNPNIAVLLMSASPEAPQGFDADDPRGGYLEKPVDIDQFSREVRRLLG